MASSTSTTSESSSLSTTSASTSSGTSLSSLSTSSSLSSTSSGTSLSTEHTYTTSSQSESSSSLSNTSDSSQSLSSGTSNSSTSLSLSSLDTTSDSSSSSGDEGMNFTGTILPILTEDKVLPINATTQVNSTHITYGNVANALNVRSYKGAMVYLYVKGNNASCAENITFYFQISPGGRRWSDIDSFVVPLNGTSLVTDSSTNDKLDLEGVDYLRLDRIANAETDSGYTANVNVVLRFF